MTGVAVSRMAISLVISTCDGGVLCPIRSHWALRLRPHPAGDKDSRSGLIQPERVKPDHVVDAEIIFWIVALHVVVPDIEDIFPRDRHQRRILLHEILGS